MFDENLQKYVNLDKEIDSKIKFKFIHSLKLNLEPLVFALQDYAKSWINDLGGLLHEQCKTQMDELKADLDVRLHFAYRRLMLKLDIKHRCHYSILNEVRLPEFYLEPQNQINFFFGSIGLNLIYKGIT